ncbi:MAG: hypothetical protein WCP29_01605 [Acidobacteriota bacterium]
MMTSVPQSAAASRRRLPYARAWNIAARTVHLAATGTLLGGHVFGVPAVQLYPALWVAIGSGAALIALEMYATAHWAHQGCALILYAKLGLLCLVPWLWAYRVPMLLAVVALASFGSHAPRTIRHYSVVFGRVMTDPTSSA